MQHSFDVILAQKYGVHAAIILNHLHFWILKNKANNKNYFDGNYWTYNSKKAFSELFPYMTERQIDYALKKLIDDRLVITGNYNKLAYDRTLWYAITKMGYSILQNCEMETTNLLNENNKNVEPIPDIKPDTQPDIKPYISKKASKKTNKKTKETSESFDDIINKYTDNSEIRELLQEWLKVRKAKRAALTNKAIQLNLDKLAKLSKESNMTIKQYLEEVISRGWGSFFKITNYNSSTENNNKPKVDGSEYEYHE